jgi:hypothetical protein
MTVTRTIWYLQVFEGVDVFTLMDIGRVRRPMRAHGAITLFFLDCGGEIW